MAQPPKRTESPDREKCRELLRGLYEPIRQKLENNAYSKEGGSLLFGSDKEKMKRAYLDTKGLGPKKNEELDRFMESVPDRPVEEIDKAETAKAAKLQEHQLKSLDTLKNGSEVFLDAFKNWEAKRSDNLIWLSETSDDLTGKHTVKGVAVPAAIAIGIGAAVLAPFTLGTSLAVGAAAGGAAGLAINSAARKADERKTWEELLERLVDDNACIDVINEAFENVNRTVEEILLEVEKVDAGRAKALSPEVKAALPIPKAIERVETPGDKPEDKDGVARKLKELAEELRGHESNVQFKGEQNVRDSIDMMFRTLPRREYPSIW